MLLKKISVIGRREETLELPFGESQNGIFVKEISGLGPVKANLIASVFANQDGEQFHSSRFESRNLVLQMGLDPDYSAHSTQSLRSMLYSFLMPKMSCKLLFEMSNKDWDPASEDKTFEIDAIVETNEPDIFSKDPSVNVSLMCYEPDFIDPTKVTFTGGSAFINPPWRSHEAKGTVEAGFLFKMTVNSAVNNGFFISTRMASVGTGRRVHFDFNVPSGHTIEISSVLGKKYVQTRGGGNAVTNRLYGLQGDLDLLTLRPGYNEVQVSTPDGSWPWSIEYFPRHGGL